MTPQEMQVKMLLAGLLGFSVMTAWTGSILLATGDPFLKFIGVCCAGVYFVCAIHLISGAGILKEIHAQDMR